MSHNSTVLLIALLRVKALWTWDEIMHYFIDQNYGNRAIRTLIHLHNGEPHN